MTKICRLSDGPSHFQREQSGMKWKRTWAGGASFHDALTFHASGVNTGTARRFAIHLRTDKSTPGGRREGLTQFIDDEYRSHHTQMKKRIGLCAR